MARRDGPLIPGAAALAALGVIVGGATLGLAMAASWPGALASLDARLAAVVRFTVLQAGLSALLAVAPALALALAINRHPDFVGRTALLRLFAVPLALPAIVAAFAILALFGRAGLAGTLAATFGITAWPSIYGLPGILVAHVFFNLPLATRLFLAALAAIPAGQYRLAAQLGLADRAITRLVEWPALRAALPRVALLVFMLCLTSFTIVLVLGGGPAATTLEVEIYQALRFDFDPARAVVLAALQIALAGTLAVFARAGAHPLGAAIQPARRPRRAFSAWRRTADAGVIAVATLFVVAPLAAMAHRGLGADLVGLAGQNSVQRAIATSLGLGAVAGLLAVVLAWALAAARRTLSDRGNPAEAWFDRGAMLILVVPTTALAAGWYLVLGPFVAPPRLAAPVVVAINAMMALPFALSVLRPAHDAARDRHDRLCAALGIVGLARLRIVDWPVLRRPLASAFAFATALSLGDLGVIALFGSDRVSTLPWLALQRMASYRTEDAAGIAFVLGLACLALMLSSDRLAARP